MLELNVKVKPSRLLSTCSFLPRATLRLPPVTYIGKPMCIAFQANHPFLHSPLSTLHLLSVFICERKNKLLCSISKKG